MALIYCPECNKTISDQSSVCIHCGYPISNIHQISVEPSAFAGTESSTGITKKCHSLLKKKLFAIIFALLFVVVFSVILVTNRLSSEEKYLLDIVEEYQNMMNDPDSLVLGRDIVVVEFYEKGKGCNEFVFFNASGNNSYGATITSTVCFHNRNYLCKTSDFPDTQELMEMDSDEANVYLLAQLALSGWKLYGEDFSEVNENASYKVIESYSVDTSKIARKLGIECE